MKSDFQTLLTFLEGFGPEVGGRELAAPQAQTAALLDRIAVGACTKDERAEAFKLLQEHPAWIRYVAGRARLRRVPAKASASEGEA